MATLTKWMRDADPREASLSRWDPWPADPLVVFRDFWSWDPFGELAPEPFAPAFEVKETKEAFVFKADVPGVAEKDITVTVNGNTLCVGGKREAEEKKEDDDYYRVERSFGSFERRFTLPETADQEKIDAELGDGVLTIRVGKRPVVAPKKVAVKGVLHAVTEKVKNVLGVDKPAEKPVEAPKT